MRIISFIFILILIIIGVAFAMQNAGPVTLNYYFGSLVLPLSLLLVLFLAVGAILGLLASWSLLLRSRWQNRSLRRQLSKQAKQPGNL